MYLYRTAAGAELDFVVELGLRKLGFEIKFASAPKVTKGFWLACEDVGVDATYIVAPVACRFHVCSKAVKIHHFHKIYKIIDKNSKKLHNY
jgi:hypothetical protein